MLTEQGIVQRVYGGKATVRVERTPACAHCESSGSCEMADDKSMTIEMANTLGAKIDDRVEIGLPGHSLVKLSLVVYFLPVVGLIAGASLGDAFASSFGIADVTGAVVGAVAGLFVTYGIIKWVNSGARAKMDYRPRITRILSEDFSPSDDSISDRTGDTFLIR